MNMIEFVTALFYSFITTAQMVTVVCDESKIKVLLEQCHKCPKLKNIIKIGSAITDDEKAAGEKVGIKVITFKDLEVSIGKEKVVERFFSFWVLS